MIELKKMDRGETGLSFRADAFIALLWTICESFQRWKVRPILVDKV